MVSEISKCRKCGSERVPRRAGMRKGAVRISYVCVSCTAANLREFKEKRGGAAAYRNLQKEGDGRAKYLARKAVENALKAGKLVKKPCSRCGDENAHAHHDDYERRLEVMWLCPLHHKERHRELITKAA